MQRSKTNHFAALLRDTGVRELPLSRIRVQEPPFSGGDRGVEELAASVSRFGLLHPLTVRRAEAGFELICGFRRLRALHACGLASAACLIVEATDADCLALRLAENRHRNGADFLETAAAMRELIRQYGFSLEEAALCAGLTARDAADKLHALTLPEPLLAAIQKTGFTERHALALLRIPDDRLREAAFCEMAYLDLTPEAAERYVDKVLTPVEEERGGKTTVVMKDVRLFLNTVSRGLDMMRTGGVAAECLREDADNCIKLTIRIPDHQTCS